MPECIAPEESGWTFCPNLPAAALFTSVYGCCFFLHLYLTWKTQKKFCWVITIGSAWLTIGFGLRAKAAHHISGIGDFIPQSIIIFLGPLWLNGFVYMVMARMVHMLLTSQRVYKISARRISLIFVTLDVVAFFVQASSSGPMASKEKETADMGVYIMMAGVAIQQSFITFFIVLSARFHYKLLLGTRGTNRYSLDEHLVAGTPHTPTEPNNRDGNGNAIVKPIIHTLPWKRLLYALYLTLVLITIRNIFRLIEFSDGVHGYIAVHEAFFYSLDALPIFAGLIVMAVVHPSVVLKGSESEFPKREKKGKEGGRRRRHRSRSHGRNKERGNGGEQV
ncbi:RTA1 like protein-domain-containing protein [Aspergillus karnatakaensis]|uniref:RTA1 domain-containing protein n=1 Tax=Aspergillus karnatakaensis TaxID=1810916 RepID=UPI003CCD9E2A